MRPYAKMIAEKTGTEDAATLALIEELMRGDHPTLDGLSHAEFDAAIVQALVDARDLQDAGQLAMWCKAFGLEVPAAVAA
jgi:hypothetical protein